ncbi:MAG: hypothetical protein ACLP7A_11515 [Desulfobaccales bacterium]
MPGIAGLTVEQFQDKIKHFDQAYVRDWNAWCQALKAQQNVASKFGEILRSWQACRPNRMRRTQQEAQHDPPFLENLIMQSNRYIEALQSFDIRGHAALNDEACRALEQLWNIFQNLSYHGRARNGLAGIVGISKAVLLLTEGRVGPAFDSKVRGHLQILNLLNAQQWIDSLQIVSEDILAFEAANQCTLQEAAPQAFADLHSGRIYDMALWSSRIIR